MGRFKPLQQHRLFLFSLAKIFHFLGKPNGTAFYDSSKLALRIRSNYGSVPLAASNSEDVSVRVEPHAKVAMQVAAERETRSLVNMFEVIVVAYCRVRGYPLLGVLKDALPNLKARKTSS